MSERSETAPSQFSMLEHVHCLRCNAPVGLVPVQDGHGYIDHLRPADHECAPL